MKLSNQRILSTTNAVLSTPAASSDEDDDETARERPLLPFKYLAEIAYDGTAYSGFQLQKETTHRNKKSTIQGRMERALGIFLDLSREELLVQGAGRTGGVIKRIVFLLFFQRCTFWPKR